MQAALAKAKDMNIRISVAVCDAGGRLMAFNRMDGAIWGSVYGSQGKAVASAGFARPSGELAERAGSPIIQGIAAAEGDLGKECRRTLGIFPVIPQQHVIDRFTTGGPLLGDLEQVGV